MSEWEAVPGYLEERVQLDETTVVVEPVEIV